MSARASDEHFESQKMDREPTALMTAMVWNTYTLASSTFCRPNWHWESLCARRKKPTQACSQRAAQIRLKLLSEPLKSRSARNCIHGLISDVLWIQFLLFKIFIISKINLFAKFRSLSKIHYLSYTKTFNKFFSK